VGDWVLTCTDNANPPWRTSRTKRMYDHALPPNHVCIMVMVLTVLARDFSKNGVVASITGLHERQWVGACDTCAWTARCDVDFIVQRMYDCKISVVMLEMEVDGYT
jgi:hypothetical protein